MCADDVHACSSAWTVCTASRGIISCLFRFRQQEKTVAMFCTYGHFGIQVLVTAHNIINWIFDTGDLSSFSYVHSGMSYVIMLSSFCIWLSTTLRHTRVRCYLQVSWLPCIWGSWRSAVVLLPRVAGSSFAECTCTWESQCPTLLYAWLPGGDLMSYAVSAWGVQSLALLPDWMPGCCLLILCCVCLAWVDLSSTHDESRSSWFS